MISFEWNTVLVEATDPQVLVYATGEAEQQTTDEARPHNTAYCCS